jgi:hypothetical protein
MRSDALYRVGLDASNYKSSIDVPEKEFKTLQSQISDAQRFADASPFTVRCRSCGSLTAFEPPSEKHVSHLSKAHFSFLPRLTLHPFLVAGWRTQHNRNVVRQYRLSTTAIDPFRRCPARSTNPFIHQQVLRSLARLRRIHLRKSNEDDVSLR